MKWKVIDDEGILVDLESGYYFSLNPVGLFIWDRCNGDFEIEEIVEGLVEEFEVEDAIARRDLEAFLGELNQQKLVLLDTLPMSPAS